MESFIWTDPGPFRDESTYGLWPAAYWFGCSCPHPNDRHDETGCLDCDCSIGWQPRV